MCRLNGEVEGHQSVAMKTKWRFDFFWCVLSLCHLSCAVGTYESTFTRREAQVFKLGTPKSKPFKQSTPGDGKSSQSRPASTSPLSQLGSQRPDPPPVPDTPRSMRPGEPGAKIQSDYLPDVSVTCSTSDFVVRVKPAFYGLGAHADELKLGNTCKSNGVLGPYGDLLFTYPLTACDAVRQSPRGYLVYKFVLHYEPSPKRFPSRAHRIDVDIECRYQRNHHVYQLTVQPTWETAVLRKKLKGSQNTFQIELMDGSWSKPAMSQVYQLGETVYLQVSAPHVPTGGKVYINSCYATLSSGFISSLKYTIINNLGCMIDSKRDPGASGFISRTDKTLRFSVKAFQFTSDPDAKVNIHCKLFVTSEDPGPAHKSCTYRGNRWKALTGDDSICECCDSQCVTSKPRRAMMEGTASSGPMLVSDQPYTAENGFVLASPFSISRSSDYIELHSHVDLAKYDDNEEEQVGEEEEEQQLDEEESGVVLGVMTEPDLEELGFRESVSVKGRESEVTDSNQSEDDGSGYIVQEHFSKNEEEEGFEGREDDIADAQQAIHVNQREAEMFQNWEQLEEMLASEVSIQRKLQPLVYEGEEENRKHTGGGKETDRMTASDVEMTWYFTWR